MTHKILVARLTVCRYKYFRSVSCICCISSYMSIIIVMVPQKALLMSLFRVKNQNFDLVCDHAGNINCEMKYSVCL